MVQECYTDPVSGRRWLQNLALDTWRWDGEPAVAANVAVEAFSTDLLDIEPPATTSTAAADEATAAPNVEGAAADVTAGTELHHIDAVEGAAA